MWGSNDSFPHSTRLICLMEFSELSFCRAILINEYIFFQELYYKHSSKKTRIMEHYTRILTFLQKPTMINCPCLLGYFFPNILLLSSFSIENIRRWNRIKGRGEGEGVEQSRVESQLSGDVAADNNRKRLSCYKIFWKNIWLMTYNHHSAQ